MKKRGMRRGLRLWSRVLLFGTILAGFCPAGLVAQQPQDGITGGYGSPGVGNANPFLVEDPNNPGAPANQTGSDSTKKKIRKPLESYFFDDFTRKRPNFAWNVDLSRNRIRMVDIDTMLNQFQVDFPFLRDGVGSAYLGNLGGAAIPLNYFRRPDDYNFAFASAYESYFYSPENAPFYNVKKPFTHLSYFWAGQKKRQEERLELTHAQSISPSSGFNVNYKSRGTRGIYTWQKARDKNLSMAFSHTGKKYSAHGGYIYNSVDVQENGGVQNDRDITDTVFEMSENIPIRLSDARNKLKNNIFYAVQSYGIPLRKLTEEDFSIAGRSSIFVGHSIVYSRFYKKYTDTKEGSGDYYENWYINSAASRDSIFESLLSNKIFVQMQPWDRDAVVGTIDAGVGLDNHHYYQFNMDQYLTGNTEGVNRNSFYVYGSIAGKLKKYLDWGADLTYHPLGCQSQDLSLGGELSVSAFIKDHPITLSGRFRYERRSPDYWAENYYSNHYIWSNSFAKENETRFDVTLQIPYIGLSAGLWQSVIGNKIYYDANSMPAQADGSVSVTGLYAQKDFRAGGFHFNNRVLLQWSTSQEVIPVPLASAYLSYFFEFNVVKNVLRMQIGLDGRYNTKYYAFGYNPALAKFYNQREKELGNYPMVDAFANAKWKRMRIFLKFQHVNEDLIGGRNYFQVLHYPLNQRIFKIGFSWGFYD